MYHYASNNPVRYIDPDGRIFFNFTGLIKNQICAELSALDAGLRDIFGKLGNSVVNIFTGNASYQVYAKASLDILNVDCTIFDLKIGSKGKDLSFTLEQKVADEFLKSFEKIAGSPIIVTTSEVSIDIGDVAFTLKTDGDNLKVNINAGKDKSLNLGVLGKGKVSVCAGINITTDMNDGPFGTIKNRQSAAIEKDRATYDYCKSINRLSEYFY